MKSEKMKEMKRNDEDREHAEIELKDTVAKLESFRTLKQNCNLFTEMVMVKSKLDSFDDQLKILERNNPVLNLKLNSLQTRTLFTH